MNVSLRIENDEELRLYVKQCIKGQVLSIVRGEFMEMVKSELKRKIKATDEYNYHKLLTAAFKEAIKEILYKEFSVTTWSDVFIKPFVERIVNDAVANKDWNKMVDTLAKEKVKALIG